MDGTIDMNSTSKTKRPPEAQPFDVTLPEGFELGEHGATLETAAKQAGWTIERDGSIIVVRDVWTENEDHAAWLVATKAGFAVGAGHGLGRARRVSPR